MTAEFANFTNFTVSNFSCVLNCSGPLLELGSLVYSIVWTDIQLTSDNSPNNVYLLFSTVELVKYIKNQF